MKTVTTTSASEAAAFIQSGGLVAFPTETVYGLGANVFDENAIKKLFAAKQRPADNPLIVHVCETEQIAELTADIGVHAKQFIDVFFPGPLTLLLNKSTLVPLSATAGLDSIGVRMPRLDLARNFLTACRVPVAAPSANLSGRPSPTTWQAVMEDLDGRIDCILQGGDAEIGLESTVVDCTGPAPILLRPGAISLAELQGVVLEIQVYEPSESDITRSPGMRHRHYSPSARVVIVDSTSAVPGARGAAYIGVNHHAEIDAFTFSRICGSAEEYARSLFEFLRECDRQQIATIYCEAVPETGIGAALMDRLRRAAED